MADPVVPDHERYVEAVLAAVESIPPGRVASYGDVATRVGAVLGWGGPRQVGSVMARYGSAVPWWRVVRADGRPATGHEHRALRELLAEGAPLGDGRVRMREGRWVWPAPTDPPSDPAAEPVDGPAR